MHDIRYDAVNDEILVTNPFAQAVLVFRGAADGEEAPIRIIQGPRTTFRNPERLDVDPVHDEIVLPGTDRILVFPRTASGNVAPLRVVEGPATRLISAQSLAVDAKNDLIVAGTNPGGGRPGPGALLMYSRAAKGDTAPLRVVQGERTGISRINQIEINSSRGWIVAAQPGEHDDEEPEAVFVGVWSIHDNGDVPPRWRLGGLNSQLKKPRGVVLDYKHQEIIVADMRLNAVLTFSFPEIFD